MKDAYVKERDRAGIPDKYQWDLTDIYSNDAEWTDGKKKLVSRFPSLSAFQGTLAKSAANLLQCLELLDDLSKESTRLACYAGMKSDLDTRDAVYLAMDQEMNQIGSELASVSSFIEPEILTLGQEAIELYIKEEQRLGAYRHIFEDILRKKDHTKSEAEEKIIAEATLMADSPQSINSVFTNADFPYPEVTLENGTAVKLDPPAFSLQRRSEIREDRKKVFAAYMGKMNEFRRTFGAQLSAETRKNIFFTKARAYNSCLERALDNHNIPTAVYQSLISGVRNHFDTFHRYLGLRKRLLGIDELHYYDLYQADGLELFVRRGG
jgi:oligoendopeptidase F